jgi:pilus assembly protein Flp/PilA
MFGFLIQFAKDNAKREEGQAMAEYGLILALIAVVCIAAVTLIGTGISGKLSFITDALK